ncbi:hypothetical protein, partial [Phyllobacterium sp. P5_D12]
YHASDPHVLPALKKNGRFCDRMSWLLSSSPVSFASGVELGQLASSKLGRPSTGSHTVALQSRVS